MSSPFSSLTIHLKRTVSVIVCSSAKLQFTSRPKFQTAFDLKFFLRMKSNKSKDNMDSGLHGGGINGGVIAFTPNQEEYQHMMMKQVVVQSWISLAK